VRADTRISAEFPVGADLDGAVPAVVRMEHSMDRSAALGELRDAERCEDTAQVSVDGFALVVVDRPTSQSAL
jgi:hypothetical protein